MQDELKAILETILFIAPEPVSPAAMKNLHGEAGVAEWKRVAAELTEEYEERGGPVRIIEVAEGYKMVTRPEMASWVRKFMKVSAASRLSKPGLETLAIIAYRQPIIKAEIDAIRGVSSDGVLRTLLDRKMVKILGRKEMPGRPLLYGTTREFLEYFGLRNIAEMPTLKDLDESPATPSLLPEDVQEALFEALPSEHDETVPRESSPEESLRPAGPHGESGETTSRDDVDEDADSREIVNAEAAAEGDAEPVANNDPPDPP